MMISRPEHQLRSVFVSAENKRKINIKTGAPPRCSLKLSFYFVFSFPVLFLCLDIDKRLTESLLLHFAISLKACLRLSAQYGKLKLDI